MSWWEEFKENASEFFDSGHWGKKEEEGPVSVPMQSKEERIQAAMNGDIDLQRAKQDLQIAQEAHTKANNQLKEAELAASGKRTEVYGAEYLKAENAMKSAKQAYDSAAANETAETKPQVDALYHKWKAACNKYDSLSTRSLWDAKNPLESFVPQYIKDEEARTRKNLNAMEAHKRQVEAAARQRAESKVGAAQ